MNFGRYSSFMDPITCYGFAMTFDGLQIEHIYTLDESEFVQLCQMTPFQQSPRDLDDYLKVVVYYVKNNGHFMKYDAYRKEYILNPNDPPQTRYEYHPDSLNLTLDTVSRALSKRFTNTYYEQYVSKFIQEHFAEVDYEDDNYRNYQLEIQDLDRYCLD